MGGSPAGTAPATNPETPPPVNESSIASPLAPDDLTPPETPPDRSAVGADGQQSAESPEGQPAAADGTTEGEEPQGYDDDLPSQQLPAYRKELVDRYSRKFGLDPAAVAESPPLQSLIKAKIDTDIAYANLEAQQYREPPPEEQPEVPIQPTQPQQITPEMMEFVYKQATNAVEGMITPLGSGMYVDRTLDSYDQYYKAKESGDQAKIAEAAKAVTKNQMAFLQMALADILPRVIPPMIGQQVEHMGQTEEQIEQSYRTARQELSKDPEFSDLKEYAGEKLDQLIAEYPQILEMQFEDDRGRPADPVTNAMCQYVYAVDILRGRTVGNPQKLVQDGMKAGQESAARAQQKQALGKALGSGRPSGNFAPRVESDDDFMSRLKEADKRNNPMSYAGKSLPTPPGR